jgi:hypothetical protein
MTPWARMRSSLLLLAIVTASPLGCREQSCSPEDKAILHTLSARLFRHKLDNKGRVMVLSLEHQAIDASVLGAIVKLDRLRVLDLNGTNLDDDGLALLTALTSLQTLRVRETLISEAGLGHLEKCQDLRLLALSKGEAFSEVKISALKRALPGIKVYR